MTDAAHDTHAHEEVVHHGPPARHGLAKWTGPGWYRISWCIPLFFGIGAGLVVLVRWAAHWHPIWKGTDIVTVELTTIPLGFLTGLGGFDFWTRYASGRPTLPEDHSGHGARSWRDYFRINTDHKVIGMQYLVSVVFFFMVGGFFALLFRAELARPG